jgi:glycosyltransferase involved in cell wall biosynthesis
LSCLKKKELRIALLTAGKDSHYALGLLSVLVDEDLHIDFIGNDAMMDAEDTKRPNVSYFNLRGDQRGDAPLMEKALRVLIYYTRLIAYATRSDARIFHILWLNKFMFFDKIFLNIYYKLLGKKIVFTAHNVNAGERDGTDSFLNRISLRFMYSVVDHIFVHTDRMKKQLVGDYYVSEEKVSVIPFGVNNVIPKSNMTRGAARHRLRLKDSEKVMLFFGNIAPYKGLEYLISAMAALKEKIPDLRLIIAGRVKDKDCEDYWERIQKLIDNNGLGQSILLHIRYVPDEEVEVFLKAVDVMILPYKHIFQSGVIFLSYNFGLPVIAADVGSIRDSIIKGETGFVFRVEDIIDLEDKIELFFKSELYGRTKENARNIIEYVNKNNSWRKVSGITYEIYQKLLN